MKNTIMYYYNLDNFNLYKLGNHYKFRIGTDLYYLEPVFYPQNEISEAYKLLEGNNKYHKIILNRENSIFTFIGNTYYILFKIQKEKYNLLEEIYENIKVSNYGLILNHANWYLLWTRKIDYFEYQLNHLNGKYPLIMSSIDYFIGMAEVAISYIHNINYETLKEDNLCVCHRRMLEEEYFNPMNVVVDYKARDVSEYLKLRFLKNDYNKIDLKKFLTNFHFSKTEYQLTFGRMLYPSFYFDLYEQIINNNLEEEKLVEVIKRVDEYELFIQTIYDTIYEIVHIPGVEWL